MFDQRDQVFGGAALVLDQRIGDTRLGGQIFCGKFKQRFQCLLAMEGFDKIFDGQGQHGFLRVRGDKRVGIEGENSENFREIGSRKFDTSGAHRQFVFTAGSAVAQVRQSFRAE